MNRSYTHDEPDNRDYLESMVQGVLGKALPRPEGPLKVTGRACYSAEYALDKCAEGVLVTAPLASGKVLQVHKESVLDMPGILAVIADSRLLVRSTLGEPVKRYDGSIDYWGHPVALVVAESFEQARDAAKHLRIDYEMDDLAEVICDPADPRIEWQPAKNPQQQGDLDRAMAEAAHAVDVTYTTGSHASAAMEPHAAIADWDGANLTLYAGLQMLRYNLPDVAEAAGLERENVRILAPYIGGGFGSKLGISPECGAAIIASMDLGRPVRVVMSRQQVFQTITRRPETVQRVRLAADRDGKLTGFGHSSRNTHLPGESFVEPVLQASRFLYAGHNRDLLEESAGIHLMQPGAVRAPGEAVGMQVLESALDELANQLGMDPVELRLRNIPDVHPVDGRPYSSRRQAETLEQGAAAFGWDGSDRTPCARREGEWWIGTGVAAAARANFYTVAKARVRLNADGSATVESDQTDIGTGSYAILGQVAGEMLGLDPSRVDVRLGDTRFPHGAGSGGSFGAASTSTAVYLACRDLREELCARLSCEDTDLTLKDGHAIVGNTRTALPDLLAGDAIESVGSSNPGKTREDYVQSTYGAFFAEVAVNAYTGETRVRRMLGSFGIGRVLNEMTARSQCQGGMVWGIGSALTEELVFDKRDGHLINCDFAEYHVPVHRDVPHLEVHFVEERDGAASPIQAKGVGELSVCGAAGAICNAIYHACGVRVRDFPMTPDKLLADLPDP